MILPKRLSVSIVSLLSLGALVGALCFAPSELRGQQPPPRKAPVRKPPAPTAAAPSPAPAKPQVKGIWEPVNYPEDLNLTDVFCVSVDVCWVSGAAGTILKTTDGGQTWTIQLGGDPQSGESYIYRLFFVDETHGWAIQFRNQLLRTTDGETWERVGDIGHFGLYDYVFTSENVGILLGGEPNDLALTQDGGRTWKQTGVCATKLEVEGLIKNVGCKLRSLHFPSPNVGYAVGGSGDALFTMKTEDGGETWGITVQRQVSDEFDIVGGGDLFFVDENTGLVSLRGGGLLMTTDGGQSWRGLVGTVREFKFADPEVGWSSGVYTTDGGKRWRPLRGTGFPAHGRAFSLPRRDRGYLVGDSGMIYRYRVVPATEQVAANAIQEVAMPVFDSPLDEEVEELAEEAEALEESFTEAPAAGEAAGEGGAEGAPEKPAEEGEAPAEEAAAEGPVPFVESCCAKPLSKFESTLNQVSTLLPAFVGKYKNLNLLLAGLRMTSEMPAQVGSLKAAVANLRKARDPMTARMALTELVGQATALSESTLQAFQKKPAETAPPEE